MFLKLVDDIRDQFKLRGSTEIEISDGINARVQQGNFGAGSANRAAFVPAPTLSFLTPTQMGEDDDGRRQLTNALFGFDVSIAGFDADHPDRDLAHRHRCFDIFEAVVQEVHRSYFGLYEWTSARWEDARKDGRHGAELIASLTLNIPLFDAPSPIARPSPVPGQPKPVT